MPMDWQGLTEREFEIRGLIARGRSVEQAARELGVSVNTVKTHLKAIYSKLDTHTRGDASARYWSNFTQSG